MARPIEKKTAIQEGVVAVVARKGLVATTIQDIAKAANVSPGLLYRYWDGRDDLAGEVYREHLAALLDRLARCSVGQVTIAGALGEIVREFYRYADEQATILRFLLLTQHDLAARVPEEMGVRQFLRRYIEKGIDTGEIGACPAPLALQLAVGLIIQPVVGAQYGHLARPVAAHAEVVVAAVERALFATAPASAGRDPGI